MKRHLKQICLMALVCLETFFLSCSGKKTETNQVTASSTKSNVLPEWALGGFVRPEGVNPIIQPRPESKFNCPMRKEPVGWEESDTFNPAATLKGDTICVLYRAEDNSAKGIGMRTSRIGLAESTDGITMVRRDKPVMYPAEDNAKEFEWPGGCEDPRVAMTEDGLYVMLYTAWNRDVPRLSVATSKDLLTWKSMGLLLPGLITGVSKIWLVSLVRL